MAVPTIPSAISLSSIQTEFGGSNPISMSEYYAGGTYVSSGRANATSVAIPSSGQISFASFSGATAAPSFTLAFSDSSVFYVYGAGYNYASSTILTKSNGQFIISGSTATDGPTAWGSPLTASIGSNYQIQVNVNASGLVTAGSAQYSILGTSSGITSAVWSSGWVGLSADKVIEATVNDFESACSITGNVSIRHTSGSPSILRNFTVGAETTIA